MNMRIVMRTRSCLIAVAALVAAAANGPAGAAGFGGALQAGSTVCTDWLRTDGGGVYLLGYAAGAGTYTWTMRMSSAAGGPETVIFRAVATSITRNVVPPAKGRFFYRNCLNVSNQQAAGYRLTLAAGIGNINPVYGIGPHTATITPGSTACGEFAMGPVRLRGTSNQVVFWSLRGTDMDYGPMGDIFSTVGATVNPAIDPGPTVVSTDACATNTAPVTARVSFELLKP